MEHQENSKFVKATFSCESVLETAWTGMLQLELAQPLPNGEKVVTYRFPNLQHPEHVTSGASDNIGGQSKPRLWLLGSLRNDQRSFALLALCALREQNLIPLTDFLGRPGWKDIDENSINTTINRWLGTEKTRTTLIHKIGGKGLQWGECKVDFAQPEDRAFIERWLNAKETGFPKMAADPVENTSPVILKPKLESVPAADILMQCQDVGLVGIYRRKGSDGAVAPPPRDFLMQAQREVVITGLTNCFIFINHTQILLDALESGIKIFVAIIHPKEKELVAELERKEKKALYAQLMGSLDSIKREQIHRHENFRIKFFHGLPEYCCTMIDGDLMPEGGTINDNDGEIRVQHLLRHSRYHDGLLFQYKKNATGRCGGFERYASDLRTSWKEDMIEDPRLFD